jgi:hypothetical protein
MIAAPPFFCGGCVDLKTIRNVGWAAEILTEKISPILTEPRTISVNLSRGLSGRAEAIVML